MPLASGAAGGTGPGALDAAVLRIFDGRGASVGLGFLITPERALTCAHVISAALGLPDGVEPAADVLINVDLPLLPPPGGDGSQVTARVEHWVPPRSSPIGDVAVLRLSAPLPGGRPIRLVEAQDVWGHPVRTFGFPAGRPGGVWHSGVLRARQANGWVQADLATNGYRISRGFSGGPVWDEQLVGVIGMVAVAEAGEPPAGYLIPTDGLLSAWVPLRELALPPSPFRGLSHFQEADAPVFHGRRSESSALADLVARERWTALVGPSGSGKSSLAMAGAVPLLRASGASVLDLRPDSGSSPLAALAAALLSLLESDLSETDRILRIPAMTGWLKEPQGLADVVPFLLRRHGSRQLVLIVDQFEELLQLGPVAVDELAGVLFDDSLPGTVRVLVTVRADFLETALAHPRLGPFVRRQIYALGPLSREQLREIITAPITSVPGVRYEPHLADRILADTGTEPGALPLLGLTLDLLWQNQAGGLLTHQVYEELGGVAGALSRHADEVWARNVPAKDEAAARRLFTQLIRIPAGTSAATRRMASRADLGEDEWRIAQQLATTRLLVTALSAESTQTVELAHEALITGWDKLADWVAQDRAFLVWRESLRHDRDRWERAARTAELLPTTTLLAGGRQWLPDHDRDLNTAEHAYLEAGRTYRRSRTRKRRALFCGTAVIAVLALVFGTLFVSARQQSRERESLATSRALTQASQDAASVDPVRSVMLALAAYQTSPTQEARNQLLRTYVANSDKDRVLSGLLGTVQRFQTSRDGNVVLATSKLGKAMLFVHAVTGTVRSEQVPATGQVLYPMVSADGKRAGYAQEDGKAAWFSVDADAVQPVGQVHTLPDAPGAATGSDKSAITAMSLDGTMIVSRVQDRLVWWNLDSNTVGGSVPAPTYTAFDLSFGADNRALLVQVAGPERQHIFGLIAIDLATGATRTVVSRADSFGLSGDRTSVVVCRKESGQTALSRLRVSDGVQQGQQYREQDQRYKTDLCSLGTGNVDTTGHRVALWYPDARRVVDLDRGKVVSLIPDDGHGDGSRLVSGAGGRLFNAESRGSLISYTELPAGDQVLDVSQQALTDDASRTVSVLADGSSLQLRPSGADGYRILAEAPRPKPYWKPEHNDLLRFTRDGRLFADREGVNVVSVRDAATLRQTAAITAASPPPTRGQAPPPILGGGNTSPKWDFSYFFDPRGNLLTVSGTQVEQWDPHTGSRLAHFDIKTLLPHSGPQGPAEILVGPCPAPNTVFVITLGDPVIRIVDIITGRTTDTVKTTDDVLAVQFDPSGRYFALMRRGSVVELWRRHPLRRELGPFRSLGEDSADRWTARFLDGDGRYLIAANNTVRTYRVGDRSYQDSYEFGPLPTSDLEHPYWFLDSSKDGKTLIYADPNGLGGTLALDPAAWQRELCRTIGSREFTADERASLPVHVPASQVCPSR
ncbi:trypsin-like peptidase domain-containing protein [Streptomyces sp. NPDC007172]|uniref:nSTAND1 domain-containing NTPase n=1 Tax=Streptomyces sp. NPDC007172 TaxID=3364776 RepID=UPI00369AB1B6